MAGTPMNVYFSGKKANIPTNSGNTSIDLSGYATKEDLLGISSGLVSDVIDELRNMAKDEDMDFVKIYNDTRTDDDDDSVTPVINGDNEADDNI